LAPQRRAVVRRPRWSDHLPEPPRAGRPRRRRRVGGHPAAGPGTGRALLSVVVC
jgi:hypothetical protein